MDESRTAFASQYPPYGFDIKMMKVRPLSGHSHPPSHLTHPTLPIARGLWIPQVVQIPNDPVSLQTPSVRTTDATAETVTTPLPTTATCLSPAFPRANSMAPLPVDLVAFCTLPHPSLSTPTPMKTWGHPPSSALTLVSPLLLSRPRPPSVPMPTPHTSA